ncbi:MAG: PAS domain S-box protein, partial [Rhodobacteraceae bacterium]|nr:PAS domain S-box protein [Paracoccaceae bacterium]
MGLWGGTKGQTLSDSESAVLKIVEDTQAVIHFDPNGIILEANGNFLAALEYSAQEVVGKHHSIFVSPEFAASAEYRGHWDRLRGGEALTDQFPRITRSGRKIWIQATYAPVRDARGQVIRVTKIATDVTRRRGAIERLSQGLESLSHGNLTDRVPKTGIRDLDELSDAFNRSLETFSSTIA